MRKTVPWYKRWWYNLRRPQSMCPTCGDADALTCAFGGKCYGCLFVQREEGRAAEADRLERLRTPKRLIQPAED